LNPVITDREIRMLEFDAIRERLAEGALTPPARRRARELLPIAQWEAVERLLRETGEGRLLCAKGAVPLHETGDLEPVLERARRGGVLSGEELYAVSTFLRGVQRCRQFFRGEEAAALYPLLSALAGSLQGSEELLRQLRRSVDSDGSVLDEASPELASLRRKQRALQEQIREKMNSYLRSSFSRYLQEPLITIRNGRYVLPVKQEYRHQLKGIVHDQSASGATLFVEPEPVVIMQNELSSLARQEEREVERILSQLSALVGQRSAELLGDWEIYTELDFILARGRLSLEMGGAAPRLFPQGSSRLHLEEARHPLLEDPVPLNLSLGEDLRVMVITGPNTGGKTVALKTVGLMAVMAQCGLHLPAGPDSRLSVFRRIRTDIGDEQSLLQSLSTFSGHLKNIISILQEAGPGTLVLLDELGAGTDPSEGAALAMAILAELSLCGALTMVTTHINELKLFAQVEEGMQNASMEFDQETLSPTYRLLQGVPGQSNAFVIAEKLGLPERVMERGRNFLHRDHAQVEAVIASLVEERQRLSRDSREAALKRARAESLLRELEAEREQLRAGREKIRQQAREEARQLLRRTRKEADQILRELRQIRSQGGTGALARGEELRRQLHRLQEAEEQPGEEEEARREILPPESLAPGAAVLVGSLNRRGEILSLDGEEALVQVGAMKVTVPVADLGRWQEEEAGKPDRERRGGYTVQKEGSVSPQIDLRGQTLDEALQAVEKFLDDALWAGLSRVTVIHGRGTGRLQEGLRRYFQEQPLVKSWRRGLPNEGGDGVTILEL